MSSLLLLQAIQVDVNMCEGYVAYVIAKAKLANKGCNYDKYVFVSFLCNIVCLCFSVFTPMYLYPFISNIIYISVGRLEFAANIRVHYTV